MKRDPSCVWEIYSRLRPNRIEFGIGQLPGRKLPSLYVIEDGLLTNLATFKTLYQVRLAKDYLRRLVEGAAKLGIAEGGK